QLNALCAFLCEPLWLRSKHYFSFSTEGIEVCTEEHRDFNRQGRKTSSQRHLRFQVIKNGPSSMLFVLFFVSLCG
ncbi:hypothetical protein, partial [Pedobacter suwonensis]|uniref:hypothetical protein n=1 Tax=Pedobacter suwonensis TaxID=332999 RepID=UPI00382E85DE